MKGNDIIIFGGIDWNMQWQWQQELALRLSQNNRVVFVENTGVRSIKLTDTKRVLNRLKNFFSSVLGFKSINKNLVVYSPLFFPFPYNNFFINANAIFISGSLNSWKESLNFNPKYIFSFISTPLTIKIINKIPHDFKVFIYTDKMSKSSEGANKLSYYIKSFAKKSDLCFFSANDLKKELAPYNKKLFHFPGGVDFVKFNKKINLRLKKKKIIGYIGQVKNIIDFNLIKKISEKFKDAEIQLVGPLAVPIDSDLFPNNVKFVGSVPHEKIPDYVSKFDVGIIPYVKNDYTNNISPAKLNEYLSVGLPCISTDLNEIKNFNKINKNIVDVCKNNDDFLKSIKKHLNMNLKIKKKLISKRVGISRKYDWKLLFERFVNICQTNLLNKNFENEKNWIQGIDLARNQFKKILYRISLIFILIFGLTFFTPLASYLGSNLTYYDKLEKSDVVLIVSGSGSIKYLNTDFQSRYNDAMKIYELNLSKKFIIMRREHNSIEEGELIKRLLVFKGIPMKNIEVVDKEFKNTYTNYQYIEKKYLKEFEKIILITSPYHSLRSKMIFNKLSEKNILIAKVSDSSNYKKIRLGLSFDEIKLILREYVAIIYAYTRGWI